jgi:hypothetical protein
LDSAVIIVVGTPPLHRGEDGERERGRTPAKESESESVTNALAHVEAFREEVSVFAACEEWRRFVSKEARQETCDRCFGFKKTRNRRRKILQV